MWDFFCRRSSSSHAGKRLRAITRSSGLSVRQMPIAGSFGMPAKPGQSFSSAQPSASIFFRSSSRSSPLSRAPARSC